MGQQQLLLVILVTIIVGIATVVAINIFGQAADQANVDAVRQDLMAASVQAQAIWSRPALMNGADRDFNTYSGSIGQLLALLNIPNTDSDFDPESSTSIENENGVYSLEIGGENSLTITGEPASGGDNIIATVQRNETTGNWSVQITEGTSTESSDE